jgi:hypothetical protein
MIDRRTFLRALGSSLFVPKSIEFLRAFLEAESQPFIQDIAASHLKLPNIYLSDVSGDGNFRLMLATPSHEPPSFQMTYREYAEEYLHGWEDLSESLNSACEGEFHDDGSPNVDWIDPDSTVDRNWAFDNWWPDNSPDAKAFDLLDSFDLGLPIFRPNAQEGWIEFTNGPCPGNDSRFVDVDGLGASLLQQRLIERGYHLQLKMA